MSAETGTPRTLEQRLEKWQQRSGAAVSAAERRFIADMRYAACNGVGYGWMQQIIEWEWQNKSPHSWGPECYERELAACQARLAEAGKDAERYRWLRKSDPCLWPMRVYEHSILVEEEFDKEIDAALASDRGGEDA